MKLRNIALATAVSAMTAIGVTSTASAAPMSGTEHFLAVTNSPNGTPSVALSGPITDAGTDQIVNNHRDIFALSGGNLVVLHWATSHSQSTDKKTCTLRYNERGTYRVIRGTGDYAGAVGHGTYRLQVVAQGCDQSKPPTVFLLVIRASGPLHI